MTGLAIAVAIVGYLGLGTALARITRKAYTQGNEDDHTFVVVMTLFGVVLWPLVLTLILLGGLAGAIIRLVHGKGLREP